MISRRWIVPACHGNVQNAYVNATKEDHLEIYMKLPDGMVMDEKEIDPLRVKSSKDLALLPKKSLCGSTQTGRLWRY